MTQTDFYLFKANGGKIVLSNSIFLNSSDLVYTIHTDVTITNIYFNSSYTQHICTFHRSVTSFANDIFSTPDSDN